MGRMLIEAIRASDDCVLVGALDVPSSPGIGSDACAFLGYASGVAITADLKVGPAKRRRADRLHPPRRHPGPHGRVRGAGVKAVIGTTGFTDAQRLNSTLLRSAPPSCFRPT